MAPRQILLIVLAFLAITETSTSSSSSNRWFRSWRRCRNEPTLGNGTVTRNGWNKIVYGCNTGFGLKVTTDCHRGNSWTSRVTCEVQCPSGENITGSADKTPSAIFGNDFIFDCSFGFTKNGFNGTLTCGENGDWIVKTPCTDCLIRDEGIFATCGGLTAETETECTKSCESTTNCSLAIFISPDTCVRCYQPMIFYEYGLPESQCIEKCKELPNCLTAVAGFTECFLYSETVESTITSVNYALGAAVGYIIVEKNVCNL